MALRSTLLATAATACLPAAAQAQAPEPLVDRRPATTEFSDRVLTGAAPRVQASAAQGGTLSIPTQDGSAVRVSFTSAFPPDQAVAESYVAFLDSLPHGPELGRLRVLIGSLAEVGELCGGGGDVLACYHPATQEMTVPGQEVGGPDVPSTSYVVAHEYGHHIAANRDNDPFAALDFGPKYWSSQELVCAAVIERQLAPGDEGEGYRYNPGENWAEAYARLTYPDVPWTFAESLVPDVAALEAARRDVLEPWTGPTTQTFTLPAARRSETFPLTLTLDGSLRARAAGSPGSDVALAVFAGGRPEGRSHGRGARQRVDFEIACRDAPIESMRFKVTRRDGSGPVSLRVTYAG